MFLLQEICKCSQRSLINWTKHSLWCFRQWTFALSHNSNRNKSCHPFRFWSSCRWTGILWIHVPSFLYGTVHFPILRASLPRIAFCSILLQSSKSTFCATERQPCLSSDRTNFVYHKCKVSPSQSYWSTRSLRLLLLSLSSLSTLVRECDVLFHTSDGTFRDIKALSISSGLFLSINWCTWHNWIDRWRCQLRRNSHLTSISQLAAIHSWCDSG